MWSAIFPATASDRVASLLHLTKFDSAAAALDRVASLLYLTKSDSAAVDVCFAVPVIIVHMRISARCILANPVRRHIRFVPIACVFMWFCGVCSDFLVE